MKITYQAAKDDLGKFAKRMTKVAANDAVVQYPWFGHAFTDVEAGAFLAWYSDLCLPHDPQTFGEYTNSAELDLRQAIDQWQADLAWHDRMAAEKQLARESIDPETMEQLERGSHQAKYFRLTGNTPSVIDRYDTDAQANG